jgi:hypothetical protein
LGGNSFNRAPIKTVYVPIGSWQPYAIANVTGGAGYEIVEREMETGRTVRVTGGFGGGDFYPGEIVALTATPDLGHNFVGWYVNNVLVSTDLVYMFTVPGGSAVITVEARQVFIQHTVTAIAGIGGTVTGGGSYNPGTRVTLTAAPNPGGAFEGWYEGSERISRDNTISFSTTGNRTLYARFSRGVIPNEIARPAPGTVYVNGIARTFECYEIRGVTYFKLVDVGTALRDTNSRFAINFVSHFGVNGLNLVSGSAYNNTVTLLNAASSRSFTATPNTNPILVNGTEVDVRSYFIDGSSYYLLSDLGRLLGFVVARDASKSTPEQPNGPITITAAASAPPPGVDVARPAPGRVYVNGVARTFECYEIRGVTYFKLIDVGTALMDTSAKFGIDFISHNGVNGLNLVKGAAYNNTVTPLNVAAIDSFNASPNTNPILVNGTEASVRSYFIGGSSYYLLSELGSLLGFSVSRDSSRATPEQPNGPIVIIAG